MKAAALLAALALAPAGWHTHTDVAGGFAIAVPARWQVVPRTDAALAALARRLRQRGQTALANELAVVAVERRRSKTRFAFQALEWPPPPGAAVPDVTVRSDLLTPSTTAAALPAIARDYAKTLAGPARAKLQPVARLRLPAGEAARVAGSAKPAGSKVRFGFVLYLVVHGRRLYSVAFRGSAAQTAAEAPLFARIAGTLRLG